MSESLLNSSDAMRLLDGVRDPIRWEIILLLGRSGAMNVGEITTRFHISRPAISHHLKVLKDAGIVSSEKIGQEVFYGLNREQIVGGLRQIANSIEDCCIPPS